MDATDLSGVYTYRSFRDVDDPGQDVAALLFGQGELSLLIRRDGGVSGTLAFPADAFAESKDFMDLSGTITSWAPLKMNLTGKGRANTDIADFEYDYDLSATERWPTASLQKTVLVGTVLRAKDHGKEPNIAKAGATASVLAIKRAFVEPKDVKDNGLLPAALAMLASKDHRLQHAVWHTLRAVWWDPALTEDDRAKIAAKGWEIKRPPRKKGGALDLGNGAGEDFLYMHRQMIGMVRKIYADAGVAMIAPWDELPAASVQQVAYRPEPDPAKPGQLVFIRDPAASGFAVPGAASDDERWVKSAEYFATIMRPLSVMLRQPRFLAALSLGALGNLIEMTIHNAMHQRWASVARNPRTGDAESRGDFDFGDDWNDLRYDYLGEFYSSHVNPIFWRLHGWVDARIDEWFAAQETAEPGRIKRADLAGVEWFETNAPWVQVATPLDGMGDSSMHGVGGHHHHDGTQNMLDVMGIVERAFARPATVAPGAVKERHLMSFKTWAFEDSVSLIPGI